MAGITDINGNPYTTAAEDMRLKDAKHRLRQALAVEIDRALKASRDGRLELNLCEVDALMDQLYYLGRDRS